MAKSHEDQMLEALGADTSPEPVRQYTRQEERLIAGFEDIQRFVDTHGRPPRHGEDLDIFERLYAVRLDRLRQLPAARELLASMDAQGLLSDTPVGQAEPAPPGEDALLAKLGATDAGSDNDITVLKHVRAHRQRQPADGVAMRQPCNDFDQFEPLFEQVELELRLGVRKAAPFKDHARIDEHQFFILGGQTAYIAHKGEETKTANGTPDARLRVIFSNGTESNLLMRSMQHALTDDKAGRRLTGADDGPLFSDHMDEDDAESGTIYVLRSQSDEPFVAEHRKLIHKIGVTGGKVETRIGNAKHDPTYLLADVEVVATWKLSGINRTKLENLLHRIFAPARLELTIEDRFGNPVQPREWFLVPLPVLDEAVRRIRDGSITDVAYDPATASLVERKAG